jgi:virulence plasmid B protein
LLEAALAGVVTGEIFLKSYEKVLYRSNLELQMEGVRLRRHCLEPLETLPGCDSGEALREWCHDGRSPLNVPMLRTFGGPRLRLQAPSNRGKALSTKSDASNQVISLPQGGGALHGIGETFAPDLHTGTGLTIPGVTKTSKGIPRYADVSDTFLLSGAEDLVPGTETAGATSYRPRTEGLFARIEHRRDPHTDHWEVRTKDGLVSVSGHHSASYVRRKHSQRFRGAGEMLESLYH